MMSYVARSIFGYNSVKTSCSLFLDTAVSCSVWTPPPSSLLCFCDVDHHSNSIYSALNPSPSHIDDIVSEMKCNSM